ncbi:MAG: ABC transporter permease [Candidatus Competibacteraceae bacterium]|nr:ABC transporter permease [Candidatus Competibacteraceae bacterium]
MKRAIDLNTVQAWLLTDKAQSPLQAFLGRQYLNTQHFLANGTAVCGLAIILLLVIIGVFAPVLAPYDPIAISLVDHLQAPSAAHWMGTDEYGRDILSRVIYGARETLYIVGLVLLLTAPFGLLVGCISGYIGGWVDIILMRLTDIVLAFPSLILALAFVAALGPSIENAVIAIAITRWPPYARIARAETITLRRSEFISAIRLQGASTSRIVLRHIVPMTLSSVIIRATLDMAAVILIAAGLGFLGLGAQPPTPEWGAMLSTGRKYLLGHWWVGTFPGLAIFIVSMGFNLLGDGLRDVLDPRSNR